MVVKQKCPYYLGQSNGHKYYITCGRDYATAERIEFGTTEERKAFKQMFCDNETNQCEKDGKHNDTC